MSEKSVKELEEQVRALYDKVREKERNLDDKERALDSIRKVVDAYEKEVGRLEEVISKFEKDRDAVSRLKMLGYEVRVDAYMRMLVVMTFAFVGPILLATYSLNIAVDPLILDIFKIWLGAAIGISTNLLQKTERIPTISEKAPTSAEETKGRQKKAE